MDEDHLRLPPVSRSGRKIKKSAKRIEADESFFMVETYAEPQTCTFRSFGGASYIYNTESLEVLSISSSDSSCATYISLTDEDAKEDNSTPSSSSNSENIHEEIINPQAVRKRKRSVQKYGTRYQPHRAEHKYCTRFKMWGSTHNGTKMLSSKQKNVAGNDARMRKGNGYTLWSSLYRSSAMFSQWPRREISKKVSEMWKALPPEEKQFWACKAKELSQRILSSCSAASESTPVPEDPDYDQEQSVDCDFPWNNGEEHVLGIAPVDTAAHLKLLGDSLSDIGQKILLSGCKTSASGTYSVLLDTLLCSVGSLLCLTRQLPGLEGLPTDSFAKTLDHVAYFFPGL